MTKYEFDHWLRYRLSDLPPQEVERISAFYQDAIAGRMEDGMTEDEAIYALGEPEGLLEDIRASLPVFEAYEAEQHRAPSSGKRRLTPLVIVLGCCLAGLAAMITLIFVLNVPTISHVVPVYEDVPAAIEIATTDAEEIAEYRFRPDSIDKIAVAVESAPIVVEASYDDGIYLYASPACYRIYEKEGGLYVEQRADTSCADNTIRLQLPGDRSDYHLTIQAEVGDVELYGIVPASLQVGLELGNIWLSSVSALEGIELRTEVGMISGMLRGAASDYQVEASVVTGSSNLGNRHTGQIRLWASVEAGDIDVYFEE